MTVLFDFDGTIANTLEAIVAIYNQVCERYSGRKIELSEIENLKHLDVLQLAQELGISVLKFPLLVLHTQSEMKQYLSSTPLFEGLEESLHSLHINGHRLGIVTSNTVQNVNIFLLAHNLDMFDFVYGEKEYFSKGKKIRKVIRKHVQDGEKVIYVGDEVRDIVAAREAGIDCVAVSWGFNSLQKLTSENPITIVSDPKKLADVIQSL